MKTNVGHNQENTIGKNIKTVAKEEISQDSGKKTIIASGDNTEISARKDLDLYGKKNLIGFTDGKTEFGAKEQMHVYGANSLITAKDKIEYKAPQMNKLPESGKFKYDKEKQILSVKWMCSEMENKAINEKILLQNNNQSEKTKVIFPNNIIIIWDSANNKIVKDINYKRFADNKLAISILINAISDAEDLKVSVCSKNGSLKKGDVAFLYLENIGKIEVARCLNSQFDVLDGRCPYPEYMLDYLEQNRELVKQKVKACNK